MADKFVQVGLLADGVGTEGDPYQLLATGITETGDGDTLWLMDDGAGDGTFDDANQTVAWYLDWDTQANITMRPWSGNTVPIVLNCDNDTRLVDLNVDHNTSYKLTIIDVTLDYAACARFAICDRGENDVTGSLRCEDCIITDGGAGKDLIFTDDACTKTEKSIFEFIGCTISTAATSYLMEQIFLVDYILFEDCILAVDSVVNDTQGDVGGCNSLTFRNCTGTVAAFIYHSSASKCQPLNLVIEGNTITSAGALVLTSYNGHESVRVIDNDFTSFDATPSTAIGVGYEYDTVGVTAWTGGDLAVTAGDYMSNDGELYEAVQDHNQQDNAAEAEPGVGTIWEQFYKIYSVATRCRIIGNKVRFDTEEGAHCIMAGYGMSGVEIAYNDAGGGDWGVVAKGHQPLIHHNVLFGVKPLYVVHSLNAIIANNICFSTSGPACQFGAQGAYYSKGATVLNNIFDASGGGSYALVSTDATAVLTHMMDRNNYVGGSGAMADLGGTDCDTVAEMQAKWLALGKELEANDANSSELDPMFKDITLRDFRLGNIKLLSLALDSRDGLIGVGALLPIFRRRRTRNRRYSPKRLEYRF